MTVLINTSLSNSGDLINSWNIGLIQCFAFRYLLIIDNLNYLLDASDDLDDLNFFNQKKKKKKSKKIFDIDEAEESIKVVLLSYWR